MNRLLFILILCLCTPYVKAQDSLLMNSKRPLNNINICLVGHASGISVHYERLFKIDRGVFLSGSLGIGSNEEFVLFSESSRSFLIVPISASLNLGAKRSMLQLGVGYAAINDRMKHTQDASYGIVGYRLLPMKKEKVSCKLFVMIPFMELGNASVLIILAGISVGIAF